MIDSPFNIISFNANTTSEAMENALEIAVQVEADLVLFQEPWFYNAWNRQDYAAATSTAHSNFTQILLNHLPNKKPRTIAYISKTFKPLVSLSRELPIDTDIQFIDISEGEETMQIINIYNQKDQGDHAKRTFQRHLYGRNTSSNTIVMGDFNSHHLWWNPAIDTPNQEADELVEWIEDNNLSLLNKPGEITFIRPNTTTLSILDLALVSQEISDRVQSFRINNAIASDHWGLQLHLHGKNRDWVDNPVHQSYYNTKKADWKLFGETINTSIYNSPLLKNLSTTENPASTENSLKIIEEQNVLLQANLDAIASALTEVITLAVDRVIPRAYIGSFSKPWWTPELRELRKQMTSKQRYITLYDQTSKTEDIQARNTYFEVLKRTKTAYWNQFLEMEDPKAIFKAMKYTKDGKTQRMPHIQDQQQSPQTTFEGKCKAFRETLFQCGR